MPPHSRTIEDLMRRVLTFLILLTGLFLFCDATASAQVPEIDVKPVNLEVPVEIEVKIDGEIFVVPVIIELTIDPTGVVSPKVAATVPVSHTYTISDTASIVPSLEDLPTGWLLSDESPVTAEDISDNFADPEQKAEELQELGLQGGTTREFENGEWNFFAGGNALIAAGAAIFDTAAGAQEYMNNILEDRLAQLEKSGTAEDIETFDLADPALGDASLAFKISAYDTENDMRFSDTEVWATLNNMVLMVQGASLEDSGDVKQLIGVLEGMLSQATDAVN